MSLPPPPDLALCVRPASQLVPRAITWLWLFRLALGKLSMLDGDPGLGKSLVTLDLCARLSTGRLFPEGSPGPGIGRALVLNAEDGHEDTFLPRLQALGADLDRVFYLHDDDSSLIEPLRLPSQAGALDQILTRIPVQLLVIDPIMAFLDPGVQTHNELSVRRALFPLKQLAAKHRCAVLLVRHLNKSGGTCSLYRGGGSIGFLAACRSAWLIERDPQEAKRCILAQVKNNLAAPQPSLAFQVGVVDGVALTVSWHGLSSYTADDLLAGSGHPRALPTPRERGRDFLASVLEDGPRTSRDIWALAEEQGLSVRTLHRARQELKGRCLRVCVNGHVQSYWLLPGQQLPATVPAEAAPFDLEPWIAPLREQFPPLNPLDDV